MKTISYLGVSVLPAFLTICCFAVAWFVKDVSSKHAYVFLVAGGFMSAAVLILILGKVDDRTRVIRAFIAMLLGFAVILYGKFQFLSGVL